MITKSGGRPSSRGGAQRGADGRLYVLEDSRNVGRFKVLSDREVEEEERRVLELASQRAATAAPKPVPVRSSSPKASKAWMASMDEKAGAQTKTTDFLNTSRGEDCKAGSKGSPPSSPMYRRAVSQIVKTILSESQEKPVVVRQSLPPRPVSAVAVAPSSSSSSSAAERGRPSTAGGASPSGEPLEPGAGGGVRRSVSAGRSRLLDNDMYLMRREWDEAKVRAEREEREARERELQERLLRASKNGKEFEAMRVRAEKCRERNVQKAQAKKEAADAEERKARQDREDKRRAHLSKQLSNTGDLSWREILEQQEMRRRENVEKHKQELLLKTRAPGMVVDKGGSNSKRKQRQIEAEAATESAFQFKAEDPVRVAAKLAKMQRAFEARKEAQDRLAEERRAAKTLQASASAYKASSQLKGMEDREAEAKARAAKRGEDRRKRELAEEEAKKDIERKKTERLLNIRIPEEAQRLTKAAKNRADLVQKQKSEEKARLEKEAREKARKDRIEREMSLTIKAIVDERERERKDKLGGFTELSSSEAKAAEKAREVREAYKQRRAELARKVQDVISNRPSLIERHEQVRRSLPLFSFSFSFSSHPLCVCGPLSLQPPPSPPLAGNGFSQGGRGGPQASASGSVIGSPWTQSGR